MLVFFLSFTLSHCVNGPLLFIAKSRSVYFWLSSSCLWSVQWFTFRYTTQRETMKMPITLFLLSCLFATAFIFLLITFTLTRPESYMTKQNMMHQSKIKNNSPFRNISCNGHHFAKSKIIIISTDATIIYSFLRKAIVYIKLSTFNTKNKPTVVDHDVDLTHMFLCAM